jgi:alpha-galactosidase
VGLENNDDTRRGAAGGNGSVTFAVRIGDKEIYASDVRRLANAAIPLDLPLGGAHEFEIRVGNGGDSRGWDQALWGEAVVELEDGSRLRLQDLPLDEGPASNPFGFSFIFDGKPSAEWLKTWTRASADNEPDPKRLVRQLTWRDPKSGLQARVEAVLYRDFPAVEWVVYPENAGSTDSAMLEQIRALDASLGPLVEGAAVLHSAKGAVASFDDFAPVETRLKPETSLHFQPGGGRSSSQVMPFFNVQGATGGVIVAIGWTGEWAADFAVDAKGRLTVKAGMARTHLRLHPGEAIRTPRMLLLFYEGDRWRGQNLLRQFILAHRRPRLDGRQLVAPITCGNWGGTSADIHLDNIRLIAEQRLPIEYYWIDAEWYGRSGAAGGWPINVGNWNVKRDLYPQGFKPLSDALERGGRRLMLWFEPERVFKDTPWQREHRDWLLNTGGDNSLLNLGRPEARLFLTDFISSKIEEFGLGCYRQDFNIDPLPFWQAADAPDRQGMTEIRHIEGLYAFWDELLRRHPRLLIDNCASGGRRIDIETVGRATPFWRTDGPRDPIAHQCHTYGLMAWVPLSSTSQDRVRDDYEFRASMCSALCLNWWVSGDVPAQKIPADFPFDWARRTLAQYLDVRKYYYGDYYPLTAYSQARDVWMAYQLDRPDLREGLVVVLKRPESPYAAARLPLRELDAAAQYEIRDLDSGRLTTAAGADLMRQGLPVALEKRPDSALIVYRRKD